MHHGAVDVNTVTRGYALEAVDVEPRDVEVCQRLGVIQGFQAPHTASLQILPDSTAAATREQLRQSSMLETADHSMTVT